MTGPLAIQLWATMQQADQLVTQLRQVPTAVPAPQPTPVSEPAPTTAVAPTPRPSPLSIPVILLSLGGLCILVAALVFVAVAWGSLGIGGRTAILGLITLLMGAGAVLMTVKDLRWAAETFWVIVAGMLTIDVLGARAAGLFGAHFESSMRIGAPLLILVMLCLGLLVGTWSARAATGQIISVQVSALIGISIGNVLAFVVYDPLGAVPAVLAPVLVLMALISRKKIALLGWGLLLIALCNWLVLFGFGFYQALEDQPHWWISLNWWPLVLAGCYMAIGTLPKFPYPVRMVAAGLCLLSWSLVILGPDHSSRTSLISSMAAMLAFLSVMILIGGRVWGRASGIAAALWALPALITLLVDSGNTADVNLLADDYAWKAPVFNDLTTTWWAQLALGIALAAGLLAAGRLGVAERRRQILGATIPLAYLSVGLALFCISGTIGLPLWALGGIITVLLLGAIFLAWQCAGQVPGLISSLFTGTILSILVLMVTAPSNTLGAIASGLVLATTVGYWYAAAAATRRAETLITLVLLPFIGFLTWVQVWAALDLPAELGLALAAGYGTVIMLLARLFARFSQHTIDRILIEIIGAIFLPIPVLAFGTDYHALALTLAGAGLVLSGVLNKDRELLSWLGTIPLGAGALVYYLNDAVVPERVSLPIAMVLIIVGARRMHLDSALGSVRGLGAGILLGLTPSLWLALIDPISWRGAIVFAIGVAVLLAGAFSHLGMPFYAGAFSTAILAIRYLGPWAQGIPRWVGIGIVGLLLLGLGVSWEFGRKNLRTASDYLRSLR
ncbi:MAG TPA: hypothetical protein PKX56_00520 [Marmoricola sp.]|nr:hypothetical protein [Marmoricola sp.]HNO39213.1 hypothetical protein [Marmoricola sp.]